MSRHCHTIVANAYLYICSRVRKSLHHNSAMLAQFSLKNVKFDSIPPSIRGSMSRSLKMIRSGVFALALLTLAKGADAQIFTNGTPDQSQANARGISLFRSADDFSLASSASVTSIRFWMLATDQSFAGLLSYAFYNNSAGALGSVVSSGSVSNVTPTFLSHVPGFIYNTYQVDINLPSALNLAAGTYWLELHDGATLTTNNNADVYWSISANMAGNARQSMVPTIPTDPTNNALSFSLYGTFNTASTTVPEPSTMALSFAGLVALGLVRLRKREDHHA